MAEKTDKLFTALARRTCELVENGKEEITGGFIIDKAKNTINETISSANEVETRDKYMGFTDPPQMINITNKASVVNDNISKISSRLISQRMNHKSRSQSGPRKRSQSKSEVLYSPEIDDNRSEVSDNSLGVENKVVATVVSRIRTNKSDSALVYAMKNIDELVDNDGNVSVELSSELRKLSKDELVNFIESLLGTLK